MVMAAGVVVVVRGGQRERSDTRGFSLGRNGRSIAAMAVGGGGGAELMR
jgi:hypothetical protein